MDAGQYKQGNHLRSVKIYRKIKEIKNDKRKDIEKRSG